MPVAAEKDAQITSRELTDASFDLPMLNGEYRGKPYRFVYGVSDHGKGVWWNGLIKVDLETGEKKEWYQAGHYPSEPNFIARPGSEAEDDGVLLSTVLAGDLNTSYLLVLNATTMEPMGRALAPHFLPFPSHGFAEADP